MIAPTENGSSSPRCSRFQIFTIAAVLTLLSAGALIGYFCGSGLCKSDNGGDSIPTTANQVANSDDGGNDDTSSPPATAREPIDSDAEPVTENGQILIPSLQTTAGPTLSLFNETHGAVVSDDSLPSSDNTATENDSTSAFEQDSNEHEKDHAITEEVLPDDVDDAPESTLLLADATTSTSIFQPSQVTNSPSNHPITKSVSGRPSLQPTKRIDTNSPFTLEPSNPQSKSTPPTTSPTTPNLPSADVSTSLPILQSKPFTYSPSNYPVGKPVSDSPSLQPTKTINTNSPFTLKPTIPPPKTAPPTTSPTAPTLPTFDGQSGAIVTSDCLFRDDYAYAIDIYWSCGEERFDYPLRLHTFKRHSYSHGKVFADQLMTHEKQMLWFHEYDISRCVSVASDGDLRLKTDSSRCDEFYLFASEENGRNDRNFYVRRVSTEDCVTMGDGVACDDDRSTGGDECGGVDHRFLPLKMGSCDKNMALSFRFEPKVENCANGRNEYPGSSCF